MTGVELATSLVRMHAPVLRSHFSGNGADWEEATLVVVESAVMVAHGFDGAEAQEFIRTLLERID